MLVVVQVGVGFIVSRVGLVFTAGIIIAPTMVAPLSFTFGISTATDIGDFEPMLLLGDAKAMVLLAGALVTVVQVGPLLTSTSIGVSDGVEITGAVEISGAVFCIELATEVVLFAALLLARDAILRSDGPLSLLVRVIIALLGVGVNFVEGVVTAVAMVTEEEGMAFAAELKAPEGGFTCCKLFKIVAVSVGEAFLAISMSF